MGDQRFFRLAGSEHADLVIEAASAASRRLALQAAERCRHQHSLARQLRRCCIQSPGCQSWFALSSQRRLLSHLSPLQCLSSVVRQQRSWSPTGGAGKYVEARPGGRELNMKYPPARMMPGFRLLGRDPKSSRPCGPVPADRNHLPQLRHGASAQPDAVFLLPAD